MDPRHRDRVAFVRVCSGRLVKDMMVVNERLGAPVRVARPYKLFGRDRQTAGEAYAGDVVGLVNPGRFAIGDTIYSGRPVRFAAIPRFAAEHFGRLRLEGPKHKQFDDGVRQLEEEGLMQVLFSRSGGRDPIVGVVGALQFDVIEARLKSEYGVESHTDSLSFVTARAVEGDARRAETLEGLGAMYSSPRTAPGARNPAVPVGLGARVRRATEPWSEVRRRDVRCHGARASGRPDGANASGRPALPPSFDTCQRPASTAGNGRTYHSYRPRSFDS